MSIRMSEPIIEDGLVSFQMIKEVHGSITIVQRDFSINSAMSKQEFAIHLIHTMRSALDELNGEVSNVHPIRA